MRVSQKAVYSPIVSDNQKQRWVQSVGTSAAAGVSGIQQIQKMTNDNHSPGPHPRIINKCVVALWWKRSLCDKHDS